jgi:shikimate dehydrogenase
MTKRVVLIGHPVAHSLSGAMQQAAFDHVGVDAKYELWDRAPIALGDAVVELRTDDFLGANARSLTKRVADGRQHRGGARHGRGQHAD